MTEQAIQARGDKTTEIDDVSIQNIKKVAEKWTQDLIHKYTHKAWIDVMSESYTETEKNMRKCLIQLTNQFHQT